MYSLPFKELEMVYAEHNPNKRASTGQLACFISSPGMGTHSPSLGNMQHPCHTWVQEGLVPCPADRNASRWRSQLSRRFDNASSIVTRLLPGPHPKLLIPRRGGACPLHPHKSPQSTQGPQALHPHKLYQSHAESTLTCASPPQSNASSISRKSCVQSTPKDKKPGKSSILFWGLS